jgi:SAM-dependent methyltransferase
MSEGMSDPGESSNPSADDMCARTRYRWLHRLLRSLLSRKVPGEALRRSLSHALWERELDDEVVFWDRWLRSGGLEWKDDFLERLDPDSVLGHAVLVEVVSKLPQTSISILDVGAGPLTILGKTLPGKSLEITPIDPLADHYSRLLDGLHVEPPVRTLPGQGERLLELFPPESFDVAFAQNSLDHSYDPLLVIRNMLQVVKPAGTVVLSHVRNEAEHQAYSGLHQWNFDVRAGDLIVWNRAIECNGSELFSDRASVSVSVDEVDGDQVVNCVLVRRRWKRLPRGSRRLSSDGVDHGRMR